VIHYAVTDRNCPPLLEKSLASCLGLGESTRQAKLRADSVDTVDRVEVLDHQDLEAGGTALARGDDRPGEEELPDLYTS
jgi:hypothetical protein